MAFEELAVREAERARRENIIALGCVSAAVSPMLELGGLYQIAMLHNGSSNFIVTVLDEDGSFLDLIANEIGDVNESHSFRAPSEPFRIAVEADGDWTLFLAPAATS